MPPSLSPSARQLLLAGTTSGTVTAGISGLCFYGVVRFSSFVSSSYLIPPSHPVPVGILFVNKLIFSFTSCVLFLIGGK